MATPTADQILSDYIQSGTIPPMAAMKKAGGALVFACLERTILMADDVKLHVLYEAACTTMPGFTEPELRRMLQLTTKVLTRLPPYGMALVLLYLDQNELTPGLCADIRELEASVLQSGSLFFSQAGEQLFRQRLHLLRWLDQLDEIDPDLCWSGLIRNDLRGMPAENRARWRGLFRSIRADGVSRLRPKAVEEANVQGGQIESVFKQIAAALGIAEEPIPTSANLRQVYLRIAMLKEDGVYGGAFVSLSEPMAT